MKCIKKLFICLFLLLPLANYAAVNDTIKWTFLTGGTVYASPIIHNDTLFIGSLDNNFYAIDAITGAKLWQFNSKNQILSTAAIYENVVCFESGNILYGFSLKGDTLWNDTLYKGAVTNQHDQWDCFRSSPTIYDSVAYIGSEDGWVIGVNVLTGERVFDVQTPQHNATIETPPAIYDGKIFVGDWEGVFSAFDLNTEALLWQYDTKTDNIYSGWVNAIISKPLIYNGNIYFGGRNCNLYCLNPQTGGKIWMYHQPDNKWLFGGPVVSENVLYVGSSFQKVVYAFNPDEPEKQWQVNVNGLNYGDPAIYNDYVIVGTGEHPNTAKGTLSIIDKNKKVVRYKFDVTGWVQNTPLIDKDVVYFGCANGSIYALDLKECLRPIPHIYLKDTEDWDIGEKQNIGSFDSILYIYNDGDAVDSVNYTSENYVNSVPSTFNIAPGDSQLVTLSIDLSAFTTMGEKSITITFNSLKSLVPKTISKNVKVDIEINSALNTTYSSKYFSVVQNYPNPFNKITHIEYFVEKECFVQLKIFNLTGKEITTLVNEVKPAGRYSIEFNAGNLKSGSYLCNFISENKQSIRKLLLVN